MWAGIIAILQSAIGIGYAGLLIVRNIIGYEDPSVVTTQANMEWVGIGTAVFFLIIFGTVLAGAIITLRGGRWGRGPVAMLQMFLLPVAFYMFQGGLYFFAVATAVSALLGLILLFNPTSTSWASQRYGA
ncbi:hypothetical protein COCCU_03480 [Corynebacterium occultum]|uniref:Uncharacterized protein n=1 Tax=Corynebacterium occultum TaxID=2675219 RepID=A0A6B8W9G9_9CORY|nr:hypothetical protein [Corynebacterium occultum]QGU06650.1 hypothetical protein COCCU_03480 [Corynebacterium occultum]